MKKIIIVILISLTVCLAAGCGYLAWDTNQNTSSVIDPSMYSQNLAAEPTVTIQEPPDHCVYDFDSFEELFEALHSDDSFSDYDPEKYGELFEKTVSAFRNEEIALYVPFYQGKELPFENLGEGYSNIIIDTSEVHCLPWIWSYHKIDGFDIHVKIAYPSVLGNIELDSEKTYFEVVSQFRPGGTNWENYLDVDGYKRIYQTELVLEGGRTVNATIAETKEYNWVYIEFVYDGMLVSMRAEPQVFTDSFWSSFSLRKMETNSIQSDDYSSVIE